MKALKLFMLASAAVAAFASCDKNELDVTAKRAITFETVDLGTKVHVGDKERNNYPVLWDGDETVYISFNEETAVTASEVTVSNEGKNASFTAEMTLDPAEDNTFYAFTGAKDITTSYMASSHSVTVNLPNAQDATEGIDPKAVFLYAVNNVGSTIPEVPALAFRHGTAYGNLTIEGIPSSETIQTVTITADSKISGSGWFYYNDCTWKPLKNASSATNVEKSITITTDKSNDILFGCIPNTVTEFSVVVITDNGKYSYTTPQGFSAAFEAGKIASINVTVSKVNVVNYTWVETNVSTSSDVVIIVDAATGKALSSNGASAAPSAKLVVVDGAISNDAIEDAMLFKLSSTDNGSTFQPVVDNADGNKFIYVTNSNNGVRVGVPSGTNSTLFTSHEDATTGYVGLKLTVGSTTRYFGIYGGNDWRTYSSVHDNIKNTRVKIYKRVNP